MHELVINMHIHTTYSDGSGSHRDVAQAALKAGLDAVIVTDHNVWVQNTEGYHYKDKRRVLLLIGEEIHDQDRDPQKNHLLVFGAERELATLADDPQALINNVRTAGGLAFIAHPVDPEMSAFNEADISWVDWQVYGYTGIELWNGFSELKTIIKRKFDALPYAYFPKFIARGPLPETLRLWDDLLTQGKRSVAIGGSDAHARQMRMGPLHRIIFPYAFHFSAINTHVLVPLPLSGDLDTDRFMVYTALAAGHAFVGYDLPASTRDFRFTAHGNEKTAVMGDEIPAMGSVTLQIHLPRRADCRLLKDGRVIRDWKNREACTFLATDPGIYRVEAYRRYLGRRRGWIFSNPIYVK